MAAPAKINWNQVRDEYVADSTVSYADLAKKWGVSKVSVGKRGSVEGWPELRQRLADKAYEDFQQKLLDVKSAIQNEQLGTYGRLSQLILTQINSYLTEGAYLKGKDGEPIINPDTDQPYTTQPDAFQLEKLARALDIAEKGRRLVLGLPTSVSGIGAPDGGPLQGLSDLAAAAEKVLADEPSTS